MFREVKAFLNNIHKVNYKVNNLLCQTNKI